MSKRVIICGGGAAGFFAAINIAEKHPDYRITILEKSNKVLSKVKISGGGRCNVTNARSVPSELVQFYPRGEKKLYKSFSRFSTDDMVDWLEKHGVNTKAEDDLRMFPVTDSSQTIIDCFLRYIRKYGIELIKNTGVTNIEKQEQQWRLTTQNGTSYKADVVVMATGSSNASWNMLKQLHFELESPVPSLFTFNIKDERLKMLQGLSFPYVHIKVAGSKLEESGPLLITHWGLSGPAVLKLSAWGARHLAAVQYDFSIIVNLLDGESYDTCRAILNELKQSNPKKKLVNHSWQGIPKRYWEQLLTFCQIPESTIFGQLSKKQINRITEELTQAHFKVKGKSTFKEEFVTCGGVKISEVDLNTMESKKHPGLYFSGEVLNIDALTGGFNFQACWTASWIISESV
ncbi:MAG: NAD(P)/FAD-dependent oxidoreductase [Bacteroidota bacterium]